MTKTIALALYILVYSLSVTAAPADLAGSWKLSVETPDGRTRELQLAVRLDAQPTAVVTLPGAGDFPAANVKVDGQQIRFDVNHPQAGLVAFELRLNGANLEGNFKMPDGTAGKITGIPNVPAMNVAGNWKLTATTSQGRELVLSLILEQSANTVSGRIAMPGGDTVALTEVSLNGSGLKFNIPAGAATYSVQGTVTADSMKGEYKASSGEPGSFVATRATVAETPDITGSWEMTAKQPNGQVMNVILALERKGDVISGRIGPAGEDSAPIASPELKGSQFRFKVPLDQGTYEVVGKVEGTKMNGMFRMGDGPAGSFTAVKKPAN